MATQAQLSTTALDTRPDTAPDTALDHVLVREDLLVEEVSIDGMCGVY